MSYPEYRKYFLEIDGGETELFVQFEAVMKRALAAIERPAGQITLTADAGDRPILHRLLGAKIWVAGLFSVEWSNNVAALFFLDENMSEYRAIDKESPVAPWSRADRSQLRFGENEPIDERYLLSKSRATKALESFLETSKRPSWLDFEFIE